MKFYIRNQPSNLGYHSLHHPWVPRHGMYLFGEPSASPNTCRNYPGRSQHPWAQRRHQINELPVWVWSLLGDSDSEEDESPNEETNCQESPCNKSRCRRGRSFYRNQPEESTSMKRKPSRSSSLTPAPKKKEDGKGLSKKNQTIKKSDNEKAREQKSAAEREIKKIVNGQAPAWKHTVRLGKRIDPDDVRVFVRDGHIRIQCEQVQEMSDEFCDVEEKVEIRRDLMPPGNVILEHLSASFTEDGNLQLSAPLHSTPEASENLPDVIDDIRELSVEDIEKDAYQEQNSTGENEHATKTTVKDTEENEKSKADTYHESIEEDVKETSKVDETEQFQDGESNMEDDVNEESEEEEKSSEWIMITNTDMGNKNDIQEKENIKIDVRKNEINGEIDEEKMGELDDTLAGIKVDTTVNKENEGSVNEKSIVAIEEVGEQLKEASGEVTTAKTDIPEDPIKEVTSGETAETTRETVKETEDHLKETSSNEPKEVVAPAEKIVTEAEKELIVRIVSDEQQEVQLDENRQLMVMNVSGFEPRDVEVRLQDSAGRVSVTACKEIEEDGFISRKQNYRSFRLPQDVNPGQVTVTLAPSGNLAITASKWN